MLMIALASVVVCAEEEADATPKNACLATKKCLTCAADGDNFECTTCFGDYKAVDNDDSLKECKALADGDKESGCVAYSGAGVCVLCEPGKKAL